MVSDDIRKMGWPAYGTPPRDDGLEKAHGSPPVVEDYHIDVAEVSESGSVVEIRDLLCRLYGTPEQCSEPNPYLATYMRLRGTALPRNAEGKPQDTAIGTVDFGYWPTLNLGYIESVRVRTDVRKRGVGLALLNFGVDYMQRRKMARIYSFAVNREGYKLLESGGFSPEEPDDPARPWRTWFVKK